MQKKITKLLAVLFALTSIGIVFLLSQFILEARPNDNLKHIPEDATFVIRINGHKLLKDGFQTVILEEDENVVRLIQELYHRRSTSEARVRLGIDFNSDVVLFDKDLDKDQIFGMIFNLNNPRLFRKNINGHLSKGQVASYKGDLGIVLTISSEVNKPSMNLTDLKILADAILQEDSGFDAENKLSYDTENSLAKSWSGNGLLQKGEIINSSNLTFDIEGSSVLISGEVRMKLHHHQQLEERLKPDGIHLTAKAISSGIKDSLGVLFKEFNFPTGEICGVSMNYYGLELIEEPSLMIVPYFDAIIKFERNYQIRPTLDSLHSAGDITLEKDHFEYGSKTFYWRQLSNNTIYVGLNPKPEITDYKGDEVFNLSGHLSKLTNVEGTGMMRQFLELLPKYSASKSLGSKIQDCRMSIKKVGDNHYLLQGEIDFANDQHAINALLSFLLESHMIN